MGRRRSLGSPSQPASMRAMRLIHEATGPNQPAAIGEFLTALHLADRYVRWHPVEHLGISARVARRTNRLKFRFRECIGGRKLSLSYTVDARSGPGYVRMNPTGLLRLLRLGFAAYTITSNDSGTTVRSVLQLGWGATFGTSVIRRAVPLDALGQHLRHEIEFLVHGDVH